MQSDRSELPREKAAKLTQKWRCDRIRCHFWAGVPLSPSTYPHLQQWHDRIEHLPVILDALKVPSQDLVTRIKNDPELEARITKAMAERRAVGKKEEEEDQE